jgi:signal transduction histidine kinase
MAASTNYALAIRAIMAANLLEYIAKILRDELKKQNVQLNPNGNYKDETITLPLQTVDELNLRIASLSKEIRKFKAPKEAN